MFRLGLLRSSPVHCQRECRRFLASRAYTDPSQSNNPAVCTTPTNITEEQRNALDSALRIDQAGEIAANAIYRGQYFVLGKDRAVGELIQDMWDQEKKHIEVMDKLQVQHNVRPTLLTPVAEVAGFGLGVATALMGRKAAMACTEAVETVIGEHYNDQLKEMESLPSDHPSVPLLRKVVEEFRDDELEHLDIAVGNDSQKAPAHALLSSVIGAGCKVAIELCRRLWPITTTTTANGTEERILGLKDKLLGNNQASGKEKMTITVKESGENSTQEDIKDMTILKPTKIPDTIRDTRTKGKGKDSSTRGVTVADFPRNVHRSRALMSSFWDSIQTSPKQIRHWIYQGSSKGFGFAQFASSEHARAFVDPLFPFINVPPPASHGHSATAAYYKAVESGAPHNGRRVKIDYSQSATPHEKGRFNKGNSNDGTRDIGNQPTPVLLFRGLDPLSGPQAIHQTMRASAGPGKEGGKGMKRIILIKDKVTMASFGFAFVEFIDAESARAVFANAMSPQLHPAGLRISDRPVAVSYANPDSFQPVAEVMLRDEAALTSSSALGGVEGTWVRYWDESSTVAVLEFQVAQPAQPAQAKEKKEKKKKVEADIKPIPIAAPSALPVSNKPVTLNFKGLNKQSASSAAGIKPFALGFGADEAGNDEDQDEPADPSKPNTGKKVAPLISSKKVTERTNLESPLTLGHNCELTMWNPQTVNNINKWNQVQEELSSNVPPSTNPKEIPAAAPPVLSTTSSKSQTPPAENGDEFEFSDVNAMSCLLCSRQFKSVDQLKRHNNESDLHKARLLRYCKNCKDSNLREAARQKLNARQNTTTAAEQPKYRDRALERRALFNQPDVPVLDPDSGNKAGKRRHADGPPPPPSPPPPPVNLGQDANNVGNKLLKMMGWTEGAGLGIEGDGRTEPIKTAMYAEGVGLGASKGKEIEKVANAGGGYLAMAQESARERYAQ
ncbi:hypothetical protein V5O48_003551 [Marasmius crinis-equi]|uniref:5-demethoxyubiquinone hydroxylase, mitochondrial n=1 Tax=Marasmius crinis-equi TaxID=585013 RepID=A0ABR3FSM4_9AGAR